MIRSMTGFGRETFEKDGREYIIDIKSVNHKYNDISIKLPRTLMSFEDTIRKEVSKNISRGKIDVFITFQNYSEKGIKAHFNFELAKEYAKRLQQLANETETELHLTALDISKMPEILKLEEEENDDTIEKEILECLNGAIEKFVIMREKEGQKLAEDISKRIEFLEEKIVEIEQYSSILVENYIKKLEIRVNELLTNTVVDESRLAQEIVLFSDKSSIEEELTRLKSHISQLKCFIKSDSPIGKKMDFIVQEINREINTIGSKANCLEITNIVVELKTEVENIREQIQNIE